jgi:hypothetical protein
MASITDFDNRSSGDVVTRDPVSIAPTGGTTGGTDAPCDENETIYPVCVRSCNHLLNLDLSVITEVSGQCQVAPRQEGRITVRTRDAQNFRVIQLSRDGKRVIGNVELWYPYWKGRGAPDRDEMTLGSSLMYDQLGKEPGLRGFCFFNRSTYYSHKVCRTMLCSLIDEAFLAATEASTSK